MQRDALTPPEFHSLSQNAVRALQETGSSGTYEIEHNDTCIGIGQEHQQKIFERFYQVTSPEEKTYPGLGIGLYISCEIIKRHGGRLWVESEKGKGATFHFTLPLF